MQVQLPYGRTWLSTFIPKSAVAKQVQVKRWQINPQRKLVTDALLKPSGLPRLRNIARHCHNAVIVTCDKTRGCPSKISLPLILKELKAGGIREEVEVLVATGLHKGETKNDLKERFGRELYEELEFVVHDSDDEDQLVFLGKLPSGTPLHLNRGILNKDIVVIESTIEPHFFAGFTGGSKVILPGLAGTKTILENHSWQNIDDPRSRYGVANNPIRGDANAALEFLGKVFALNIVLDSRKRIAHATSGHAINSFNTAAKRVTCHSRVVVKERPDIVITTNGGYPLDRNIYQCVKGIAVPEEIMHNHSRIIMVGECADGTAHEEFRRLMVDRSPEEIYSRLKTAGNTARDQWEAQVLCRILLKNEVWFVTRNQLRSEIELMHMHYSSTVKEALKSCGLSKGERVLIAPEGPAMILKAE